MAGQPQKLTDLLIAGEIYELAANGEAALVQTQVPDFYGRTFAAKVDLATFLSSDPEKKVQDLIDHLAKAIRDLQTARDRATGAGRSA